MTKKLNLDKDTYFERQLDIDQDFCRIMLYFKMMSKNRKMSIILIFQDKQEKAKF